MHKIDPLALSEDQGMAVPGKDRIAVRPVRSGTAYRLVMENILGRIQSGEWRLGERIPTIDALEQIYACSRMTVFRAVRELIESGHLAARGRAGTRVVKGVGAGVLGILSNYDFARPEQARFTNVLTHELQRQSVEAGFEIRLYAESPEAGRYFPDLLSPALRSDLAKGVLRGLLTVSSNTPLWRRERKVSFGIPNVDINYFPVAEYRVYVDYAKLVTRALNALSRAGRRRVALIGATAEVLDLFYQTLRRLDMETRTEWTDVVTGCPEEEAGYRRFTELWKSGPKPDAVFVADDVAAKGVAHAAMALGIAVPHQLLIATQASRGIDYFYPCPVIRLEIDPAEMAGAALNLLQRRFIEPELAPCGVFIAPRLKATAMPKRRKQEPVAADSF